MPRDRMIKSPNAPEDGLSELHRSPTTSPTQLFSDPENTVQYGVLDM
jgi:hypothetical protein